MNNLRQSKLSSQLADDEISLIDILIFIHGAWKVSAICGFIGITLSISYLIITPNRFEAIAQITMAQIGIISNNSNSNSNGNINPAGVNIEEPALLISRLTAPTSFTPYVLEVCGYQNQPNAGLALSKSIKLTVPKGVASVVELKTFGSTAQGAKECSLAIFELIKTTQSQIINPYIEEAKVKLANDEERLARAQGVVAKADKSGAFIGAAYLSTRDEIRFLLDEITALKNIVATSQNRTTRLVAPIYVGNEPIAPKKLMVLSIGLLVGLLSGLLIALGCQGISRLKQGRVTRSDARV